MRTQATQARQAITLASLRERLSVIECRTSTAAPIPTGWHDLDEVFPSGGLIRNAVHEWIGLDPILAASHMSRWSPPLTVLVHLARQAIAMSLRDAAPLHLCWIGARIWPSAAALAGRGGSTDLLSRSLFVDAPDASARLWAADLALRSSAVLVLVDGSGFDMAASRRLQLAAEAGGWLAHLARPPWERTELSSAATRWSIARERTEGDEPRFGIRLLRSKGLRSMHALDRTFLVQRDASDRLVAVHPQVRDRLHPQEVEGRGAISHPDLPRRASA